MTFSHIFVDECETTSATSAANGEVVGPLNYTVTVELDCTSNKNNGCLVIPPGGGGTKWKPDHS